MDVGEEAGPVGGLGAQEVVLSHGPRS
jgi:hypothetical protein